MHDGEETNTQKDAEAGVGAGEEKNQTSEDAPSQSGEATEPDAQESSQVLATGEGHNSAVVAEQRDEAHSKSDKATVDEADGVSLPERDSRETEIRTLSDLLNVVAGVRASGLKWYRGQGDALWGLQPGVSRDSGHLLDERVMLKQFKRDAVSRVASYPGTEWGWIALAQHYGLPTRLLDWSEHPLVGLFFAVEEGDNGMVDGRLFELDPEALNQASFPRASAVLMLDHDVPGDYLPEAVDSPISGPLAVTAMRSFDRLVAQVGTFTVCKNGEDIAQHNSVRSWLVPAAAKADLRAELADLNVTASTVYPDLAHLAAHLKRLYKR